MNVLRNTQASAVTAALRGENIQGWVKTGDSFTFYYYPHFRTETNKPATAKCWFVERPCRGWTFIVRLPTSVWNTPYTGESPRAALEAAAEGMPEWAEVINDLIETGWPKPTAIN